MCGARPPGIDDHVAQPARARVNARSRRRRPASVRLAKAPFCSELVERPDHGVALQDHRFEPGLDRAAAGAIGRDRQLHCGALDIGAHEGAPRSWRARLWCSKSRGFGRSPTVEMLRHMKGWLASPTWWLQTPRSRMISRSRLARSASGRRDPRDPAFRKP